MGRPAGDAGTDPLAGPPRRTHGARWHTPIDFSKGLLPQDDFRADLRARHAAEPLRKPGLYRFYLAHTWSTTLLDRRPYRLEVEATDLRGNNGSLGLLFTIANNL